MRVWLIMLVFGQVGAVAGPLPYDLMECDVRRQELLQDMDAGFAAKGSVTLPDGRVVLRKDVDFKCLLRDQRPAMELFP